jgi:hypothetical protein
LILDPKMVVAGLVILRFLAITSCYGAWIGSMTDSMTLKYQGMFPETTWIDTSNDKVVSGSATSFRLFSWPLSSLKNGNTVVPTAGEIPPAEPGAILGVCFNDDGDKIFGGIAVFDGSAPGGVARFDADTLKFEKAFKINGAIVGTLYCDGSRIWAMAQNLGTVYVCDDDLDKCDQVG